MKGHKKLFVTFLFLMALDIAALALYRAKNIIVFTGAGISRAAGIPTYEESGLVWTRAMIDARGPEYMTFKAKVEAAEPTATHLFCAQLHAEGRLKRVYTQNIDGLHERVLPAGKVVAVHGNILLDKVVCFGEEYPQGLAAQLQLDFDNQDHEHRPDLCLVFGTRLDVFPFQVFPNLVSPRACLRFFVNVDTTCLARANSRLRADPFSFDESSVPYKIGKRYVSRRVDWLSRKSNFARCQWVVKMDCDLFCAMLLERVAERRRLLEAST